MLRRNFAGGSTRIDVEIPGLDEPLRLTAAQEDHVDDRIELGLVEGRILVFTECESA